MQKFQIIALIWNSAGHVWCWNDFWRSLNVIKVGMVRNGSYNYFI